MRGGLIYKEDEEWKIKDLSKRPLVNEYRGYELLVLNEFLKNGTETNSNEALRREGGILIGNFREACNRALQSPDNNALFKKLEEWVATVDDIIRVRRQEIKEIKEMKEKIQGEETKEDIDDRVRHEVRVEYWELIQPKLSGLLETTRRQIQDTLTSREAAAQQRATADAFRAEQEKISSVAAAFDVEQVVPVQPVSPELIERYKQEQEQRQAMIDDMTRQREEERRVETLRRQQQEEEAARLAKEERAKRDSARDRAAHEESVKLAKQAEVTRETAEREFEELIQKEIARAKGSSKVKQLSDIRAKAKGRYSKREEKKALVGNEKKNKDKKLAYFYRLAREANELHNWGLKTAQEHAIMASKIRENVNAQHELKSLISKNKAHEAKLFAELPIATPEKKKIIHAELDELNKLAPTVIADFYRLNREIEALVGPKENLDKILADEDIRCQHLSIAAMKIHEQLDNNDFKLCFNDDCYNEGKHPCAACKAVYYCSKECQKVDWKVRHKAECTGNKEKGGYRKTKRKTNPKKIKKSRRYK